MKEEGEEEEEEEGKEEQENSEERNPKYSKKDRIWSRQKWKVHHDDDQEEEEEEEEEEQEEDKFLSIEPALYDWSESMLLEI